MSSGFPGSLSQLGSSQLYCSRVPESSEFLSISLDGSSISCLMTLQLQYQLRKAPMSKDYSSRELNGMERRLILWRLILWNCITLCLSSGLSLSSLKEDRNKRKELWTTHAQPITTLTEQVTERNHHGCWQ